MTRETKIGLLVGLAFIIVIGVLLSDHLTSANNPKMSNQMAGIGGDAYTSLVTPGGANANKNVKITPTVDVLPREQVPTPPEMIVRAPEVVIPQIDITAPPAAKRDPIEIVDLGPSASVSSLPERIADGTTVGPLVALPVVPVAPVVPVVPVVPVAPLRLASNNDTAAAVETRMDKRQHKAQAGDTVSKLAYKYYGKNTKGLRDLIVKANPALQRSPDKIVVGQLYIIPPAPSAAPQDTVAASTVSRTMMASATTQPTPRTPAAAVSLKTYTVKTHDSIWRIATEQCHDINAAKRILALNKDVLKGSDKLQVGMKLKLPEKKVS